jgi:sigma-E factor negative regulatory protein RseB
MPRAQRAKRRLITLAVACTATAGALAQTPAQPPATATERSPPPAHRPLEPAQWLKRMDRALTTRNYDGTFAHWHAGRVEMLRIIHRVQDGAVSERLASLDGSGREFIRSGATLSCYLPDRRTVLVEQNPQQPSLVGFPTVSEQTASNYEIREIGRARLNRRDTHVITVAPKDEFRYGYRLWIDDSTAMPLKTQLCDAHGQVIEQIVFASLKLPAHIADSAFRPEISTDGFRVLHNDPAPSAAALAWNAMRLPPGFRMSVRSSQVLPGSANVVDQFVFTDGFASVSVFVERQTASGDRPPVPQSAAVGSSSAFSTVVEGHKITAVGEVPPATVQFIATQLKPQDQAPTDQRTH